MYLETIIKYICSFFLLWPILFIFKTTLLWAVWNLTYTYISIINTPISWFGSLFICVLIQIIGLRLSVNLNNKK